MNKRFLFILLIAVFLCQSGCHSETDAIHYGRKDNWLSIPLKPNKKVDVFYLYPTVWQKKENDSFDICPINDPAMRKEARKVFSEQATAFEPVANIYAPYYRQADAVQLLALSFEERDAFLAQTAKQDVFAAFDFYIRKMNKGRPFILAGHSQGTILLRSLLFEYMKEHPDVYQRMVAAYLIGYSITQKELDASPYLKFAEKADDTGVIISYNTESPFVEDKNLVIQADTLVINPISWTTGDENAPASMNLGSYLPDDNGKYHIVQNFADAQIFEKRRSVVCTTDKCLSIYPFGFFHAYDYAFYYMNLRENAKQRIEAYFKKANPPTDL